MSTTRQELVDVIGSETVGFIDRVLSFMEWAESEIEGAMTDYPHRQHLIHQTFLCLRPRPEVFADFAAERLVRAHMRELIGRVVSHGQTANMATGTAAECLAVLSQMSLVAPLKHEYFTAYVLMFEKALGTDDTKETIGEAELDRAWMDEHREGIVRVLDEIHRKVRDDERQAIWIGKMEKLWGEANS